MDGPEGAEELRDLGARNGGRELTTAAIALHRYFMRFGREDQEAPCAVLISEAKPSKKELVMQLVPTLVTAVLAGVSAVLPQLLGKVG